MSGDKEVLLGMGFDSTRIEWAIRETKGAGLQPALDFLLAHSDDPIPEPGATRAGSGASDAMDEDDEESQALKELYGKGPAGTSGEGSAEQVEAKVRAGCDLRVYGAEVLIGVKSIKCMQCEKIFKNVALANFHAEKSGHDQFEESTEEVRSFLSTDLEPASNSGPFIRSSH